MGWWGWSEGDAIDLFICAKNAPPSMDTHPHPPRAFRQGERYGHRRDARRHLTFTPCRRCRRRSPVKLFLAGPLAGYTLFSTCRNAV